MGTIAGTQLGIPTSLSSRSLFRREVADRGPESLPATLIFGWIAAVAYADFGSIACPCLAAGHCQYPARVRRKRMVANSPH
jgi:hypothetical protein